MVADTVVEPTDFSDPATAESTPVIATDNTLRDLANRAKARDSTANAPGNANNNEPKLKTSKQRQLIKPGTSLMWIMLVRHRGSSSSQILNEGG